MGLILIVASIILNIMYKSNGNKYDGSTSATVVGVRRLPHGGGDIPTYAPVLEFLYNGMKYTVSKNVGTSQCKYAVGDMVDIRFDTQNPKKFAVVGDKTLKTVAKIFMIVGIIFLVIEFILLIILFGYAATASVPSNIIYKDI